MSSPSSSADGVRLGQTDSASLNSRVFGVARIEQIFLEKIPYHPHLQTYLFSYLVERAGATAPEVVLFLEALEGQRDLEGLPDVDFDSLRPNVSEIDKGDELSYIGQMALFARRLFRRTEISSQDKHLRALLQEYVILLKILHDHAA